MMRRAMEYAKDFDLPVIDGLAAAPYMRLPLASPKVAISVNRASAMRAGTPNRSSA